MLMLTNRNATGATTSPLGLPILGVKIAVPDDWGLNTESFQQPDVEYMMEIDAASKSQKWLRRGDMIHYGNDHMTIMHQDKPSCVDGGKGTAKCRYKIIHAYGWTPYQKLDNKGKPDGDPIYSRKVIKTDNNISSANKLTRFGRIRLWN